MMGVRLRHFTEWGGKGVDARWVRSEQGRITLELDNEMFGEAAIVTLSKKMRREHGTARLV